MAGTDSDVDAGGALAATAALSATPASGSSGTGGTVGDVGGGAGGGGGGGGGGASAAQRRISPNAAAALAAQLGVAPGGRPAAPEAEADEDDMVRGRGEGGLRVAALRVVVRSSVSPLRCCVLQTTALFVASLCVLPMRTGSGSLQRRDVTGTCLCWCAVALRALPMRSFAFLLLRRCVLVMRCCAVT